MIWFNRLLFFGALAMAVISIVMKDADKSPIYLLLAYILWRLK